MEFVIGIDGGGTQTRAWITALDGSVVVRGDAGGANVHQRGVEASCHMLVEAVAKARTMASRNGIHLDARPRAVFAGVAGAGAERDQVALAERLAPSLLSARDRCAVDHDLRIALAGGLGDSPGLIVVAGTGSACYGRTADGHAWKAGGWGPAVDDVGSGYWIGLEGMKTVVRAADGRAPATALGDAVLSRLGVATPREMIDCLRDAQGRGMDRALAAALAPIVVEAAEGGDSVATDIVTRGAAELAIMVGAVVAELERRSERVDRGATAGGLLEKPGYYFRCVREAVARSVSKLVLEPAGLPPVAGAVLLALSMALGGVTPGIREQVASTGLAPRVG